MRSVHPTAVVDAAAELADDVEVGAYSVIGPQVCIGRGTRIGPHCVIEGRTVLGCDNRIWQFCSLGAAPQDKKYAGEPTELRIGDRNTIREFCTVNRGTVQDGGQTLVGDDNWIMAYVHVAHDCRIGNQVVLANSVQLAGHVHVGDWTLIGGISGVHQFVHIGAHAMVGFSTALSQDVPPFVVVDGNPARVHGYHAEGLRRRQFSAERVSAIKQMYRLLYRQGLSLEEAREGIEALHGSHPQAGADIQAMLDFLAGARRGIVR